MKNTPTVSFIMPTYNRGYCISVAIQSIVNQTRADWELIVVDDGGDDATADVVAAFHDKRIQYYKKKNGGAASARNYGVQYTHGEWIAYLDSDNVLFPAYLETMLDWLSKAPKAVFTIPRGKRTLELYEDGKLTQYIDDSNDTPPALTLKGIFYKEVHLETNGFMHARSIIKEGIRWDETIHAMEDWDLAMTIGNRHPNGFLYVPVVLYHYHQRFGGDGIVSNSQYGDWALIFEQIYQKHKHDKLMDGQPWYPSRVEKWRKLQADFDAGKLPPYHRYYFERTTK